MKSTIAIRDFQQSDLDAVIAIAKDLQRHELKYFDRLKPAEAIGADYLVALQSEVAKHQGRFLVAELHNNVVGYATLLTHCDSAADTEEILYTYAHIGDLSVQEDARNLGIGQALVTACENIARGEGFKWLRLAVLADNTDARRFYDKAGFTPRLLRLEKPL